MMISLQFVVFHVVVVIVVIFARELHGRQVGRVEDVDKIGKRNSDLYWKCSVLDKT